MKKFMFAAMAALAITSCSQNEEMDAPSQNVEMGVGAVVKNSTRAVVTDNNTFKQFTVYSYITDAEYGDASALGDAYISGVLYEYNNAKTAWETKDTGKYYWPSAASGKKVQFFAYPADLITDYATTDPGYPSFTYTVAGTSDLQKDLVVAHANDRTSESADVSAGKLTLGFKHILTRINFAYTPSDLGFVYTVSEISISKIKGGKGKFTFNSDKGIWDLTSATESASYAYPVKQSTTVVAGKGYYLLGDVNASLMLLPQESVADATISITYTVTNKGMEVFNGTKTVTLASGSWGIGQNILYTLTLPTGSTEMGVTPDVTDWNGEETVAPAIN